MIVGNAGRDVIRGLGGRDRICGNAGRDRLVGARSETASTAGPEGINRSSRGHTLRLMSERGVVAAGHPVTAEAGARALREGGNAVDAAIAAVLTSFVTESPLTGFGAGGFMLVHDPGKERRADRLLRRCRAERDGAERGAELVPIPVHFDERTTQVFHVGAASCGVPGNPAGLDEAARRFGSMPLAELVAAGVGLAREGVT